MITISELAKKYIQEKGNVIKIVPCNHLALSRIVFSPDVSLGQPKDPDNYLLVCINEVEVYLPHDFYAPPHPLSVELTKIFSFKSLHLSGWKLA